MARTRTCRRGTSPGARRRESPAHPAERRRGFTLIEITVVVLIIALMLSTATVRLDHFLPSSRGEAGARELLANLDLARTSAVAYGRTYTVEFDLDEGRYRLRLPFDAEGRPARDPEARKAMDWQRLPSGVHFGAILDASERSYEQGIYELRFEPLGSAEELYIYLDNDAGEGYALTVRVLALTGASLVASGHDRPPRVTEDDF